MSSDNARLSNNSIVKQLQLAKARIATYTIKNTLNALADGASPKTLCIDYDKTTGRALQARVIWTPFPDPNKALSTQAGATIVPGQDLPFVRTDDASRPTLDATIQLAGLCDEQELTFRLIMEPLQHHINGGKLGDVQQLRLALLGAAGSGKSKIIHSVLWHLFQHKSSHLVLITSYAWKAAQLISTPANPGFSSTTTFNTAGANIGTNDICRAIFHAGVVMVINDEISFTTPEHLQVGSRLQLLTQLTRHNLSTGHTRVVPRGRAKKPSDTFPGRAESALCRNTLRMCRRFRPTRSC